MGKDKLKYLFLIAVIYFFFVSINLMGSAFKLFGSGFAETLISTVASPFVGLVIGILATSIVQSSSLTTSIVVGLVASGSLSVGLAVPLVMGANLGTSITNTLVAIGHISRKHEFKRAFAGATVDDFFNICMLVVFFPLEYFFHFLERAATFASSLFVNVNAASFNSPFEYVVDPVVNLIKNFLFSSPWLMIVVALGMLFICLRGIIKLTREVFTSKIENFLHHYMFKGPIIMYIIGFVITIIVESSSVSTSLVVPFIGAGLLSINQVFPYLLGTKVGTTFTAILAALATGSPLALTIAFVHFLYAFFGSLIIYPFRKIPIWMSNSLAVAAVKNKIWIIVYIIGLFYVLPIVVIIFMR